jgi:hypothetical protein
MERRQAILYWVLASAGLMIIGAFGPWAKVLAFSVSGTDGGNDGWVIVVAAAVSAGLFLWARDQPFTGFGAIAAGLLGAIVTISDRRDLTAADDGNELADGLVQIGWGLNLATVASISLAIAGIVWTRLPQPAAADTQKPDSPSELAGPDA